MYRMKLDRCALNIEESHRKSGFPSFLCINFLRNRLKFLDKEVLTEKGVAKKP